MAGAFAQSIEAGRAAYLSGIIAAQGEASASTPLIDKPFWHQEA
jgi:thiazole synthase